MEQKMENWIEHDIEDYKNIFEVCNGKEIALGHCALIMIKILNGLSEMRYTEFYKYERQILWSAMELFSAHCIIQLQAALNCKDIKDKKKLISDIEDSIAKIMEVYKNIFDGTANAERQMFQSLPADMNMYELSPKLCAFYSSMLEKAVELFKEDGKKKEEGYAFVIHPTLGSVTEAKRLLKKREAPGKVVVIYISESEIERFSLVPIFLMHEAFHVITRNERLRQKRAYNFAANMMEYMERFLFHGVQFSVEQDDMKIRERLMAYWFRDIWRLKEQWEEKSAESKEFYSEEMDKAFKNKIKKCFVEISKNLEDTVYECVYKEYERKSYSRFRKEYAQVKKSIKQIRDNLNRVILEGKDTDMIYLLMFLYRETYADVACILTLHLEAKQYSEAFVNSIQLAFDRKQYVDVTRWAREYLVAKTVLKFLPSEKRKSWEEYLEILEMRKAELPKVQKGQQESVEEKVDEELEKNGDYTGQNDGNCARMMKINLSDKMLNRFQNYLEECARVFCCKLSERDMAATAFRKSVRGILTGNQNDLLLNILSGRVEQ